jgi:uncharacterized protein
VSTGTVTAFRGHDLLAAGALREVARVVWRAVKDAESHDGAVLVFDDTTGRVIDFEMRGDERAMLAHVDVMLRMSHAAVVHTSAETGAEANGHSVDPAPRMRGRPRLGVVAREITLLPRHWEWLATQPGGASVALRKLVDAARRTSTDEDRSKVARDAAYRFMNAVAGDLSQFEEVIRALYRGDEERFRELIAEWPRDVAVYSAQLAFPAVMDPPRV